MAALPDTVEGLKQLLVDKIRKEKQNESKLAALNAINSALQTENVKLKKDLAKSVAPPTDAGEFLSQHRFRRSTSSAQIFPTEVLNSSCTFFLVISEEELEELREEFQERLGVADRTVEALKASAFVIQQKHHVLSAMTLCEHV